MSRSCACLWSKLLTSFDHLFAGGRELLGLKESLDRGRFGLGTWWDWLLWTLLCAQWCISLTWLETARLAIY